MREQKHGLGSGGSEGAAACDSGMLTSTGGGRAPENNSTGPGRWGKDWGLRLGPPPALPPQLLPNCHLLRRSSLTSGFPFANSTWLSLPLPEEFLSIAYVSLPRYCFFLFVASSFPTGACPTAFLRAAGRQMPWDLQSLAHSRCPMSLE